MNEVSIRERGKKGEIETSLEMEWIKRRRMRGKCQEWTRNGQISAAII